MLTIGIDADCQMYLGEKSLNGIQSFFEIHFLFAFCLLVLSDRNMEEQDKVHHILKGLFGHIPCECNIPFCFLCKQFLGRILIRESVEYLNKKMAMQLILRYLISQHLAL